MNQKNNLSERNRKVAVSRWNKVKQRIVTNLLSMNKKEYLKYKSRLMGYLSGDGGVYVIKEKNGQIHYEIAFYPDHKSMITLFEEAFEFLYLKKPRTKIMNKYYLVRVNSKTACEDFLKEGIFKTMEWTVPFNFIKTDESKVEWLRAFFDCEGYVGKNVIQIQSVNKKGMYQVKKLLEDFGIESRIYKYERKNKNWNTNYILCIMKKESRKKFLNEIGFNHIVKLQKLKKHFS